MKKRLLIIAFLIMIMMLLFSCSKEASSLAFTNEVYVVVPGGELSPELDIRPKKAEYTFSVANTTIASVEGRVIKGLREGITKLTVVSGELSATTTLIVSEPKAEEENETRLEQTDYVVIYFVAEKSSFIPMQIAKGSIPVAPPEVYLGGYTMNGWYTDETYKTHFDFSRELYESITVYGFWEQSTVLYEYDKVEKGNTVVGFTYEIDYEDAVLPTYISNGVDKVDGIGAEAFKDSAKLKKVVIPANYTFIAQNAFSGCTLLEEVVFEEGSKLNYIGVEAFSGCTSLKKLVLPDSVTEIAGYAFNGCSALDFAKLPTALTVASQYSFAGTAIKSVDLFNFTQILEGAFSDCAALNEVKNTGNILRCYKNAFKNSLIYSKGLTEGGAVRVGTIIVGCASNAKIISINENEATLVADEAFYFRGKADLVLFFKGNPISIGKGIFYDISTSVIAVNEGKRADFLEILPSEYTSVLCEKKDIDNFTVLEFVKASGTKYYDIVSYFGGAVHLDLDDLGLSIRRIRSGAFYEADSLKTIKIGYVEKIADQAFNSCTNLIAIFMKDETIVPNIESNFSFQFSTLGYGACKLYVPDTSYSSFVSVWSNYAGRIYKVSIMRADGFAISRDTNPVRAHLVQYIGDETIVDVPEEIDGTPITNIVAYAFATNSSIKRINLPSTIATVGDYAFYASGNIKCIFFDGDTPPILGTYAMHYLSDGVAFYVPEGKSQLYKSNESWEYYADTVYEKSIIDSNGFAISPTNRLIQYLGSDSNLIIPGGVTSIGTDVLYNGSEILKITVPDSCSSISRGAFADAVNLQELIVPVIGDGRTTTGYLGFIFGATSYSENRIKVPKSLTKVVLSGEYKEISSNGAFYGCENIDEIYFMLEDVVNFAGAFVFEGTASDIKLYVYEGAYEEYIVKQGWLELKDNIYKIEE